LTTHFLGWVLLKAKRMANHWFHFKQFRVLQEKSAFKVGTDGVLLGAWADVYGIKSVLDIGTGTGLLALMIAQRSMAEITAIEIDLPSYEQALVNIRASSWSERIKVEHISLQDFPMDRQFDMIISNPPFFQNSMTPADKGRMHSRHNTMLSTRELVLYSKPILKPGGKLCLVFPVDEGRNLMDLCSEAGLSLHRLMGIKPTPSLPVKRYLMEFRPYPAAQLREEEITIEKGKRHDYSNEYRELTRDFYLDF